MTVDATGGSILALLGVTNITAGGSLSLTALGGTVGTSAAPISPFWMVTPDGCDRNRFGLERCGRIVALFGEGTQQGGREPE